MGKIKKLKSNELVGGVDREDVYPITSTKAVFDASNISQDDINKNRLDRIEELEETMPTTVKSITINGGQRVNTVDENGNVDLTIYSDGGQDYEGLTEVVADLRDIVGENPEEPQSGTLLERVDTLEDAVGTGGCCIAVCAGTESSNGMRCIGKGGGIDSPRYDYAIMCKIYAIVE